MEFELIDDYRARAKIPGGWLVETILKGLDAQQNHAPIAIASCFVPDAKHEWMLAETEGTCTISNMDSHYDTGA